MWRLRHVCLHGWMDWWINRWISVQRDQVFWRYVSLFSFLCFHPQWMNMPGFPVHHQLPETAQTHVHWVSDAIQPSCPLMSPFSSCPQSFPASGSFPMSWLFTSDGQSIGASASVLPLNIQSWFPLGLIGLICLQSRRLALEKEMATHSSVLA